MPLAIGAALHPEVPSASLLTTPPPLHPLGHLLTNLCLSSPAALHHLHRHLLPQLQRGRREKNLKMEPPAPPPPPSGQYEVMKSDHRKQAGG